ESRESIGLLLVRYGCRIAIQDCGGLMLRTGGAECAGGSEQAAFGVRRECGGRKCEGVRAEAGSKKLLWPLVLPVSSADRLLSWSKLSIGCSGRGQLDRLEHPVNGIRSSVLTGEHCRRCRRAVLKLSAMVCWPSSSPSWCLSC